MTGMDRAIVPTGLSYEEREREGTKMVPYSEPERRVVAAAPKQWETRRVDETAAQAVKYAATTKERDELFQRIAGTDQDIRGRVDAMHGLLGNERRHRYIRPRDRSPERKVRKRERERPGPVDRPMIKSRLFLPEAPRAPEPEPEPLALLPEPRAEPKSRERTERRREKDLETIRKTFSERIQRIEAAKPEKRSAEEVEDEPETAKLLEEDLSGFETVPPTPELQPAEAPEPAALEEDLPAQPRARR